MRWQSMQTRIEAIPETSGAERLVADVLGDRSAGFGRRARP